VAPYLTVLASTHAARHAAPSFQTFRAARSVMLTENSLDHCWMRRRIFLVSSSLGVLSACAEGGSSKAEDARASEDASAEIAPGYSYQPDLRLTLLCLLGPLAG
jgi:hypothetical protein